MSQALSLFESLNQKTSVPAHIASLFEEVGGNIAPRTTVPALGYEGKVWSISLNGEKTRVMRRNSEGDEEPVPIMRVVVLGFNPKRGRSYYAGAYDPAKPAQPDCWSDDGEAPDAACKTPQAAKCAGCPLSVKGSKVTEQGKAVTACAQHRMLAVVPAGDLNYPALRMRLAITSLWDGESPELAKQGWFAFDNYVDFLRSRGIVHTAAVRTKMRFDPNVAYPKVMFSPDDWLSDDEKRVVAKRANSDEVKDLLAGTYTPNGMDGERKDIAQAKAQAAAAPTPAAKVMDDDEGEIIAPPPKATKPAAAPKATKPAAKVMDDDDGQISLPLGGASKAATQAAPAGDDDAPTEGVTDDVDALLKEWNS